MKGSYRSKRVGAVGALLSVYGDAIADLQQAIGDLRDAQLVHPVDPECPDPDFRNIAGTLEHVVRSAFGYPTYILRHKLADADIPRPTRKGDVTAAAFVNALDEVLRYTERCLEDIADGDLEQLSEEKKLLTAYNQRYDYEQMLEHAIVHILRHHRQIDAMRARLPRSA